MASYVSFLIRVALLLSVVLCPLAAQQNNADWQAEAKAEIRDLFVRYVDHFSQGRSKEIAVKIFQVPTWRTGPSGLASTWTTAAEVERDFDQAVAAIRAQGYSHSEILDLNIRLLSPNAAFTDFKFRRYLKDGTVMGKATRETGQLVVRTADGWRIAALLLREALPGF